MKKFILMAAVALLTFASGGLPTVTAVTLLTLTTDTAEAGRNSRMCKADLTGTNRSGETDLPRNYRCAGCRSSTYPVDFRNFLFNLLVRDDYSGINGHDSYFRQNHVGVILQNGNPHRMTIPVANPIGQAYTVHLFTYHNEFMNQFGRIVSAGVNHWRVQVIGPGGDPVAGGEFYPGQGRLPVPSTTVADPRSGPDDPCRNNDNTPRPGAFDSISNSPRDQSWHSHPQLWGYTNLPIRKCGYSVLDDGRTRKRTCGWF